MTVEDIVHSPANRARARQAPLGPHIDNILTAIEPLGYKSRSLRDLAYGLIQFGEYLRRQGLGDLSQLRFHHVEAFIATQPLRQCRARYQYPISRGVWAARHLWRYACATGITVLEEPTPAPVYSPLLEEWLGFLERHRGLAPKSLNLYRRHIRRFLEYLGADATEAGIRHASRWIASATIWCMPVVGVPARDERRSFPPSGSFCALPGAVGTSHAISRWLSSACQASSMIVCPVVPGGRMPGDCSIRQTA